ncbi:MAG: hypothetical protein AB8B96_19310 [Lysobacterales bacterium]
MFDKKSLTAAIAIASLGFNPLAAAQIESTQDASGIVWHTAEVYDSATLKISGPSGLQSQINFQQGESLYLDFSSLEKLALGNGAYAFELVLNAAPLVSGKDAELVQRLRAMGKDTSFATPDRLSTSSGSFLFNGDQAVDPALTEARFQKDIVQQDDVIITQSLCVGQDCNNGENFSFDTIRLKENNLRLHFDDTSVSASFPSNDWRIVANDSSNGGGNYLAIEDSTAGRQPFRVDAGAPANSLRVDSGGDVGIGNANPLVPLHITDGNSPTMRLEQDGSSGFTSQTWDVAGNETNFFIRDVTNGSKLPLRIRPNAPSDSVYVDSDGDIGLGTNSPSTSLHVSRSGFVLPLFQSTNNSAVQVRMKTDDGNRRVLGLNASDVIQSQIVLANNEVRIAGTTDTADLYATFDVNGLNVQGSISLNGTAVHPDYVFEPSYALESIEDHGSFMWSQKHLPAVGPATVGEDGRPNLDIGNKTLGILEELEKAHIYIEQLNAKLKDQALRNSQLENRLSAIEASLKR